MNKEKIKNLLNAYDFGSLFNELGWDKHTQKVNLTIDGSSFALNSIAHKRGFIAFICENDSIPDYNNRKKIEQKLTKQVFEHIIIFVDKNKTRQKWVWVKREQGKPSAVREEEYNSYKSESLLRKIEILEISLDEEELLTIGEVSGRMKKAFDVDKITKKFYDVFKTYKDKFQKFIEGISELSDLEWYTSLMMNRLMFIYFIQKKGFLDNNKDYLRERLKKVQHQKGKDKFYSFYKDFLRTLFHGGLGTPEDERSNEIKELVGKVPYLNGGLFDEHQIEKEYPAINIPDKAFERVFEFFDGWQWVLDDRPAKNDKEINPEVIGYIFEKYINQKQMGAYYTKEDITEYIGKNTIIPYIFEEARKGCEVAFKPDSASWRLLKNNPDRYIYDAVKHGVNEPLPEEIEKGIDTSKPNLLDRRKAWNKTAPESHALPTEIWREVVERRNRYFEVKKKLESGEMSDINDFITYNLNIRQFAEDVIENSEGPELIRAIYFTIAGRKPLKSNEKPKQGISILDPTCGSGAFLFAALNILEPIYEACIERMKAFIEETDDKTKYKDFRDILADCEKHPSSQYFIYKSIILNNLYGVDIMNEAVEIAKLRLFLKLVSQVDTFEQIEALPDIDFNIRCGNSLIGFATYAETKAIIESAFDFENTEDKIKERAQKAAMAFDHFKKMQIERSVKAVKIHEAKDNLLAELKQLNDELNVYLGGLYGKSPDKSKDYEKWLQTHQPFHWWVEYYNIIENNNGFDVIIGNPPYVEYVDVSQYYTIRGYRTIDCQNLFAFVFERSYELLIKNGRVSLIIPLTSIHTHQMKELQNIIKNNLFWGIALCGDTNPSVLFVGARMQLFIACLNKNECKKLFLTSYIRFYSEERNILFQSKLQFVENDNKHNFIAGSFAKYHNRIGKSIIDKMLAKSQNSRLSNFLMPNSKFNSYYLNSLSYFSRVFLIPPTFKNEKVGNSISSHCKKLFLESELYRNTSVAVLASNIFYIFWLSYSYGRQLNKREVYNFPINFKNIQKDILNDLSNLSLQYNKSLKKNSQIRKTYNIKTGNSEQEIFYPRKSKTEIDEIDKALARYYNFTEEELDFIINYDIKYRMGAVTEEE